MLGRGDLALMDGGMNTPMDSIEKSSQDTKSHVHRANFLSGRDWLKNSFSIWRNLDKSSEERKVDHPATFSIALAEKVISCFVGKSNAAILDIFAGSGTALIAAQNLGFRGIGFDLNPEYKQLFSERIFKIHGPEHQQDFFVGDSLDLLSSLQNNSINLCFSSPPYWKILNRKRTADNRETKNYSNSHQDIGNIESYSDYLEIMALHAKLLKPKMEHKGYFILNVMDLREGPNFFAVHCDLATKVAEQGFSLEDIIIWDRQSSYNSMRPLGYPRKFIVNKVHEYLLVFRNLREKEGASKN